MIKGELRQKSKIMNEIKDLFCISLSKMYHMIKMSIDITLMCRAKHDISWNIKKICHYMVFKRILFFYDMYCILSWYTVHIIKKCPSTHNYTVVRPNFIVILIGRPKPQPLIGPVWSQSPNDGHKCKNLIEMAKNYQSYTLLANL